MAHLGRGDQDLTKIATLQKFDGSFDLNSGLANLIGVGMDSLTRESRVKGWNESAWATTVVLAFFVCKLEKLAGDWELMADKSKLWLNTNYESLVEVMFEKALGLFQS